MKTRSQIKREAKSVIAGGFGRCVLPAFIGVLIIGAAGLLLPGIGSLLMMPIAAGIWFVYSMLMKDENPGLGSMFVCAFQENYGRKLAGMLLAEVYLFFWSLLFIVPGIIKYFSYCMTTYILANYPNVPAGEAITLSRRIMNGHKWHMFVLYLTFIGWSLLSVLTLGILSILYVSPYMYLTMAGQFDEYVKEAIETGRITEAELRTADRII